MRVFVSTALFIVSTALSVGVIAYCILHTAYCTIKGSMKADDSSVRMSLLILGKEGDGEVVKKQCFACFRRISSDSGIVRLLETQQES